MGEVRRGWSETLCVFLLLRYINLTEGDHIVLYMSLVGGGGRMRKSAASSHTQDNVTEQPGKYNCERKNKNSIEGKRRKEN